MSRARVVYRDVTHDPEAESTAADAPELREELIKLGFRRVSFIEVYASKPDPETVKKLLPSADAAELIKAAEERSIVELLTSPDRRAFATVQFFFGAALIDMHSVIENGVVVETVMNPPYVPEVNRAAVMGYSKDRSLFERMIASLVEIGLGPIPRWSCENWPRSGYHLELVETDDAGTLWRRHQERVEDFSQAGSGIRPHDTLPLYLSTHYRAEQISERQHKWGAFFTFVLAVVVMVLVVLIGIEVFKAYPPNISPEMSRRDQLLARFGMVVPPIIMGIIASMYFVLLGLAKTHLVPRLPGPPLQPVDELLQEVPKVMTTEPPGADREGRQ